MTLKIGISGIRGIVGQSLTDEIASDFSKAFASYVKAGTVVIGRDTRASGKKLEELAISTLNDLGINVINAGICPTPTVQFLVKKLKAQGGLIITASHNPSEWNGFKFTSNKGIFLNERENKKLLDIYLSKKFKGSASKGPACREAGKTKILKDPASYHIKAILNNIDIKGIRKNKFKVVIDSCNGAGSIITIELLKQLGCEAIPLYSDPTKGFPRGTEPIPENLTALCQKVKEVNADVGFAQDPDADRLSIVTDEGVAIGEEYTLALSILYILSSKKGGAKQTVVTNLSTSMMIDDIAKRFNAKVIRTKVGEINVVEELIRSKAIIGGEGNGGIIYPKVVCSRDSLTGISLILELMAKEDKKISEIVKEIPKYHMIKSKISCSSRDEVEAMLSGIKEKYKEEKMDLLDGIKVIFKDSWLHVRPSNTEPVIRIIAEGKDKEKTEGLIKALTA